MKNSFTRKKPKNRDLDLVTPENGTDIPLTEDKLSLGTYNANKQRSSRSARAMKGMSRPHRIAGKSMGIHGARMQKW